MSTDMLWLLNLALAIIMYGVALTIRTEHFKELAKDPKPILVGVLSQWILLPLLTLALCYVIEPVPSMALGMFLVAACPGGNVSNFFSMMAKGNTALSVVLTSISSVASPFITPLVFTFWASLYAPSANLLRSIEIDAWGVIQTITLILVLPLILGIVTTKVLPKVGKKLENPFKKISIVFFAAIVIAAILPNREHFANHLFMIILLVFIHNGTALLGAFGFAKAMRQNTANTRSITIETGIQNSGLGLVIIFNFFDGLGGMALITAFWGIWHLFSGMGLSYFWSRKSART